MIIDAPKSSQIPHLRRLWQQAFGDTEAFLDGFFSVGFSTKRCRCLWDEGALGAALYWFDCKWQSKKIAYIYAVATDEVRRGRGFCRTLMESTHALLKQEGYHGAILVPGNKALFALYEKLGYRTFCPMTERVVAATGKKAAVTKITAAEYATLQKQYLPADAVFHTQPTLAFVATFAGFYKGDGFAFCGGNEAETFYFQEFLGDTTQVGAVLTALKAEKGQLRIDGGENYAMYRSFRDDGTLPACFDIPLN